MKIDQHDTQGNTADTEPGPALSSSSLAIGLTTAPRKHSTLEHTLRSLRRGGFSQRIELFAEPGSLPAGWAHEGVAVHLHTSRLGCYPNWLHAANWLLRETTAPFLLICEDDAEFCRAACEVALQGLHTLPAIGYVSLYTPINNIEEAKVVEKKPGWHALNLGKECWGSLAYAFERNVLQAIVSRADHTMPKGTDGRVSAIVESLNLNCWHHLPSLAKHIGLESTVGNPIRAGSAAAGYRVEYDPKIGNGDLDLAECD